MPKITVKVDPDLCIGAASCVTVAPEFFILNQDNKALVLDPAVPATREFSRTVEVTEGQKETIILAAQSCPTLAIFVYDEEGNQLFPK